MWTGRRRGKGRKIIHGEYTGFKPLTNTAQIPWRCVKAAHFCRSWVNFSFVNYWFKNICKPGSAVDILHYFFVGSIVSGVAREGGCKSLVKEVRNVGLSALNCDKFSICCNLLSIFFFVFIFLRGLIVANCKLSFSPFLIFQKSWGAWEPAHLHSGNPKFREEIWQLPQSWRLITTQWDSLRLQRSRQC